MRNKADIFRAYNAATALGLDKKRLNKALGLAQLRNDAGSHIEVYGTTAHYCGCPDKKYHPAGFCKGQIALALRAA